MTTTTPRPVPTDGFPTLTSRSQAETEAFLLEHLPSGGNLPTLNKNSHMHFLARNLVQGFPARYTSQDASQPWLLFWTVQAFSILQVELDPGNKQRVINKILACQHPNGGFGGGPGQAAHLLPTYAAVCTLAIVGSPGPTGGWDQINRQAMLNYFYSLKQSDGSFLVTHHAEVDVRGIYCLLAVATLLDILTPSLVSGTASFIASCQTYEGGFASASQPYYSPSSELMKFPRPTLGEAHGGYTFCAVASWVLLKPLLDVEDFSTLEKPDINIERLKRWLLHAQGGASELGGFKGRTNKLVDGCYSWWCGGTFVLIEALTGSPQPTAHVQNDSTDDGQWEDVDDSLFDRKALQEYILYAGQHHTGGLRDKPPKNPDAYHTLYCLAGLSAAQHRVVPSRDRYDRILEAWSTSQSFDERIESFSEDVKKIVFASALSWAEDQGESLILGGQQNRINATHPLFTLAVTHSDSIMCHFYHQKLPRRTKVGKSSS